MTDQEFFARRSLVRWFIVSVGKNSRLAAWAVLCHSLRGLIDQIEMSGDLKISFIIIILVALKYHCMNLCMSDV